MAQNVPFTFGPNAAPGKSRFANDGRLINAFVEPVTDGKGGTRYEIHADPGLDSFADTGEDNFRGSFKVGSVLYVVAGEQLFKVTAGGATSSLGTITGDKPVIVAVNANTTAPQAVIVADNTVYELQADVLEEYQDADLGEGVHSVDFLDGYFILGLRSGIFQITDQNDTAINALDFAEAEGRPDAGVRIKVHERRMWYFGDLTTEVWVNTGNADFPLERDTAFIETGCLSKHSVVTFDNTLAFVDHRARVVKFNGYTPTVISTAEVERDIRRTKRAQRSEEIEGFVWFDAGREFYVLSGPDWTWVFDASTQLWHQKKSHLSSRWIGRGYIDAFDKHLVGSFEDGILYEMSHDYKDEVGSPLIMDLRSAILGPWPANVSWEEIAIDFEVGVGNADVDDPLAMISWSDDAGATFSAERFKSLGQIGEYYKTVRCHGCGMSGRQGRMIRVQISAAVNRAAINGNAVVTVMSS